MQRKLKPDHNITGALIPLSLILTFGIVTLIFSMQTGLMALAVLLWAFSLFYMYAFIRTWNVAQLVIFFDGVFFGAMLVVMRISIDQSQPAPQEFGLAYFSGLVFFGVVIGYLVLTRKFKWRGREVFELAAAQIEETGNGYTPRPRPVGKVEYSFEQMNDFARFTARNLIALPYFTTKNITLVPVKMGEEFGRLLGLSGDYRDATWVSFDASGEVSVHIAQVDYLDYRQPLAFDQLCASLGQLFIDFMDLYLKGEGVRVIDRMDELKIGVLS